MATTQPARLPNETYNAYQYRIGNAVQSPLSSIPRYATVPIGTGSQFGSGSQLLQPGGIPTLSDRYAQPNNSTGIGQSLFEDFRSRLGATGFKPIQDQDPRYYESIKQGMKEDLRNEFFGSGGRFETGMAAESAAGRLGSPVAQRILQNTVTEPFSKGVVAINRNVFQLQQESRNEIAKMNATFNQQYNDMAFRISQAERGVLSQEQVSQLDADLRAYEARLDYAAKAEATAAQIAQAQMEDARKGQELSIDYLRTPIEYNETTSGIGSNLNEAFGGGALPTGGPVPLNNTYNSLYSPNQFTTSSEAAKLPPQQFNALPSSGSFYGQIVQGPDGRNYAWRGGNTGWQVIYS